MGTPITFNLPPLPDSGDFTDEADAQAVAFQVAAHVAAVLSDAIVESRGVYHNHRARQETRDAESMFDQVTAAEAIGGAHAPSGQVGVEE